MSKTKTSGEEAYRRWFCFTYYLHFINRNSVPINYLVSMCILNNLSNETMKRICLWRDLLNTHSIHPSTHRIYSWILWMRFCRAFRDVPDIFCNMKQNKMPGHLFLKKQSKCLLRKFVLLFQKEETIFHQWLFKHFMSSTFYANQQTKINLHPHRKSRVYTRARLHRNNNEIDSIRWRTKTSRKS